MTKIKGYAPYYNEYLDNMETYDLTDSEHTVTIEDQGSSLTKVTIGKNVTSIGKEATAKTGYIKSMKITK